MATSTATRSTAEATLMMLVSGLVSGLTAGVAMGIILHAGSNMMPFIGALYGHPTVAVGWVAHLINSAIIGVVFVLLISRPTVNERLVTTLDYVIAGMIYATLVGLVTAGIMLPVAMQLTGVSQLPQPAIALNSLTGQFIVVISVGVAHLVYGFVLGWLNSAIIPNSPPELS